MTQHFQPKTQHMNNCSGSVQNKIYIYNTHTHTYIHLYKPVNYLKTE